MTAATPPDARRPGRPRDAEADRSILETAAEILRSDGFRGLTVSEVVRRSGVARATVYRRYPTLDALRVAASSVIKGRPPYKLTGDIPADLRTGGRVVRRVFADPDF